MDFKEYIISMLVGFLAQFLMMPSKAAQYAKYLLKARDWLNLLFPVSVYPPGGAFDGGNVLPSGMTNEKVAVPIDGVKTAQKNHGFNIPFIKGM